MIATAINIETIDMTSRNLLHISKLDEFKDWLTKMGIPHRDGRGDWQALQIQKPGDPAWHCIFNRIDMKEHHTVATPIIPLVQRFIRDSDLQRQYPSLIILGAKIDHTKTPRYITITHGMSGNFAVEVWWNPENGGFWEPYDTGIGRYKSPLEAIEEAAEWAAEDNLPLMVN